MSRVHGDEAARLDRFEDALLDDFATVLALRVAFDRGVIERLAKGDVPAESLDLPPRGCAILLALLRGGGIAEERDGRWSLSPDFAALVSLRGLALAARARFTALAAADLLSGFDDLLVDLPRFMAGSRTFRFFRYERAWDTRAAHLEDTAPWTGYVTALSEREAAVLAPLIPLEGCTRLLEIGGNTGAFALALLAGHPALRVTVLDLPAVCRLGRDYVADKPAAARLTFCPGDARADPLPEVAGAAPDAILFKSMLHDWEAAAARAMLARAADRLAPGGRIIVCERGRLEDEASPTGFAGAANLVFAPFFRTPEIYRDALGELGLRPCETQTTDLDMRFHVVSAEKHP